MDEVKVEKELEQTAAINEQEQTQAPEQQISLDANTAFTLKLQEFDKKIAEAECTVSTLKKDRASYIYDQNVQQIVFAHKERLLKQQIEEETKKKLQQEQN